MFDIVVLTIEVFNYEMTYEIRVMRTKDLTNQNILIIQTNVFIFVVKNPIKESIQEVYTSQAVRLTIFLLLMRQTKMQIIM